MRKFFSGRFLMIFITIVLCLPAAAVSAEENYRSGPLPAWVKQHPADDDLFMYFVGSGQSAQGTLSEAEKFAVDDIISQIVKFIGVQVRATTTQEAVGSLDEYTASIQKQIVETSSARLSGFRVREKWFEKNARGIMVYILVSYERKALLAEKERLEKIFISFIEAVTVPEAEGEKLKGGGRYFEAALRYIDAAVAAAESTLEDADVAFNRNFAKAMACIEKINLIKLNDNLTGFSNEELSESFRLKTAAGATTAATPVPGTAVRVTYFESKGGSDLTAKTVLLAADADGIVSFTHPKTTVVGKGNVIMALELSAQFEKLKKAEKKFGEKVAALRKLAFAKKQEFKFSVRAKAGNIPLIVFVVDLDQSGVPLPVNQATASGIKESLSGEGFQLKTVSLDPSFASTKSNAELAPLFVKALPGVERAIVGTAMTESYYEDQGRFILKATATVRVIDINTHTVLFEKTLMKSTTGSSLNSARTAAFKLLGKELGVLIATHTK